jgi:hypothetical protein
VSHQGLACGKVFNNKFNSTGIELFAFSTSAWVSFSLSKNFLFF